jgi:hypothetical protein
MRCFDTRTDSTATAECRTPNVQYRRKSKASSSSCATTFAKAMVVREAPEDREFRIQSGVQK